MSLDAILSRHTVAVRRFLEEGTLDDGELYEALYEHWLHEMPYGTAKARTGDPGAWIAERLEQELKQIY